MIFYFSGTGNSRWVAEQISILTGDEARDIVGLDRAPDVQNEAQIGIVFPVYAWGAPEPVCSFVKTLKKTDAFTFGVCTCGSEAGYAMKKLSALYPLKSCYSLVMPNNYVIGGDVDGGLEARHKIEEARGEIEKLTGEISRREEVYRVNEGPKAGFKSSVINFGFNKFARSTKAFYATDACNGCGLCAKNCPAKTIAMVDGRPQWGKQCYQCLRCINECPQQAIQYGKQTEDRGRYTLERCLKGC